MTKPLSPFLRVSMAINLGQALLLVLLLGRPPREAPPAAAAPAAPPAYPVSNDTSPAPSPSASGRAPLTPELVTRLEHAGLSRAIVAQALLADFNHRWDQHVLDVEKRYAPRAVPEREYIELGRAREAALVRELKTALGEEGYRAWHQTETLRVVNGAGLPLAADEAAQACRLQNEFDETHRELQRAMEDGVADMADAVALQMRAREALDAGLEALFGKARLDAMRGYTDPVAQVYRTFGDLSPTPDQARDVLSSDAAHVAREQALAARLRQEPADLPAILANLQANDAQRDAELGRIFGPDAYAATRRRNDPVYQTIRRYAEAWALAAPQIEPVYAAVAAFQRRREQTLAAAALGEAAGHPMAWREINAALAQERQKTEDTLRPLLGDERLHRLAQNGLLAR